MNKRPPRYSDLQHTGAALVVATLMAACGGTTDSEVGGTNITSGVASKGPLSGANVCAYAITANAIQGAQIGNCTKTDTVGSYSINLGSYTGPVLFKAEGGSYTDEATGKTVPLGVALHSLVANSTGGPMSVAITALTELAYQNANAQTGRLSTANIQSATASVQNNFGIPDITNTQPVDALKLPANATEAQKNYALALAGVSQYLRTQPDTSLASGLQTLQACLAAPTTGCGSGNTSVGATLSTALNTFVANHSAFTGLSGSTGRVAFFGRVLAAPSSGADGAKGSTGAAGANGATGSTGGKLLTGAAVVTGSKGATAPAGSGVTWVVVTGTTQQAESNKGYMANNASQVAITLPASGSLTVGDVIQVNGVGLGGWAITQNSEQSIITKNIPGSFFASTTETISGEQYAAIELQYVAVDTFSVLNSAGRLVVVGTGLTGGYVAQGGLTWVPNILSDYAAANTFCSSSFNGLTGWRLPTQAELSGLYSSRALNRPAWRFAYTWTLENTWSSTPRGGDSHSSVSLSNGDVRVNSNTDILNVTCVR